MSAREVNRSPYLVALRMACLMVAILMALVDGIRKRNIFKEMITILAAAAVVPVTLIIYGVASPPYVESMEEKM